MLSLMHFKPLPPSLTLYLLKDEEDHISTEMERRIAEIKRAPCPRCKASLHPKLMDEQPFSAADPLPRLLATCECGFVQDPRSGLVLELGSAAKVQESIPLIKRDLADS